MLTATSLSFAAAAPDRDSPILRTPFVLRRNLSESDHCQIFLSLSDQWQKNWLETWWTVMFCSKHNGADLALKRSELRKKTQNCELSYEPMAVFFWRMRCTAMLYLSQTTRKWNFFRLSAVQRSCRLSTFSVSKVFHDDAPGQKISCSPDNASVHPLNTALVQLAPKGFQRLF